MVISTSGIDRSEVSVAKCTLVAAAVAAATVWALAVGTASAMLAATPPSLAGQWLPSGAIAVSSSTANQGLTTVISRWSPNGDHSRQRECGAGSGCAGLEPHRRSGLRYRRCARRLSDRPAGRGEAVHADHGVGRAIGLSTSSGARRDVEQFLCSGRTWRAMVRLRRVGPADLTGVRHPPHPLAQSNPAHPLPLPLAATIELTHPVRNVQGCAFTSTT